MRRIAKKILINLGRIIPDKIYLKLQYRMKMGTRLNLNTPKTFTEKLQWMKLYDRKPLYTKLVDKIDVKKYVAEMIGSKYILKTLGIWSDARDIDFNSLPDKFVLKTNHSGSGKGVIVCKDKRNLDILDAIKKLNRSLHDNYYLRGREWPYKGVVRRIFAEELLEDESGKEELKDYKFICCNGKMTVCCVCSERNSDDGLRMTFFDKNWNRMPFRVDYPPSDKEIPKPEHFQEMIDLAEKLAKNIPSVRVDLYEVNSRVFFGEMTFFFGSGYLHFEPKEWDLKLGELITL